MGIWNAGNFDSDAALDFVSDLIDQLAGTVNARFEEDNAIRMKGARAI